MIAILWWIVAYRTYFKKRYSKWTAVAYSVLSWYIVMFFLGLLLMGW